MRFKKREEQLTPLEVLKEARRTDRITTSEIAFEICDTFYEFHGDRRYADDRAIFGGVGTLGGHPVTIVGTQKGFDTKSNVAHNFGSPHAEGYRKAIRLFQQAEKFHRPVITFVNTSGAFCDIEAEDRGVGEAIATAIQTLGGMTVPNISILIGEGGSGGALALATTNKVWIMEDAMYSILSPEGFATILWKDASRRDEASEIMQYTSYDLFRLGIVDKILPINKGKHVALSKVELCQMFKTEILKALKEYEHLTPDEVRQDRIARFRQF